MRSTISRLAVLAVLLIALPACGSKGPLVPADQEPAKAEQPAQ